MCYQLFHARRIIAFLCLFGLSLTLLKAVQGDYFDYENGVRATRCWIPSDAPVIRGIYIIANGSGGDTRSYTTSQYQQAFAAKHGFLVMGTKDFINFSFGTGEGKTNADWTVLMEAIEDVATRSGHPEIRNAPFLSYGFSNGGQFSYGLMYIEPERTIAFCVNKGGYYIANGVNPPLTVPGILIAGEIDQQSRRDAIRSVYEQGRTQGAPWAWLEERKTGHANGNSEALILAWFDAILDMRYPATLAPTETTVPVLLPYDDSDAWLVSEQSADWATGYSTIIPLAGFSGDALAYGWAPNRRVAELYRAVASYDPTLPWTWQSNQKIAKLIDPSNTLSYRAGNSFHPDYPLYYSLEIEPSFNHWQSVDVYDGDIFLTRVLNSGSQIIGVDVSLNPGQLHHALHSVINFPDGSKRTTDITLHIANPEDTIAPPENILSEQVIEGQTASERNITFTWDSPTNRSNLGYSYALNNEPETSVMTTARSASFNELPDGDYSFRVRARGNNGIWGASRVFNFSVEAPPPLTEIQGFTASAVSASEISLSWQHHSNPAATHYVIERRRHDSGDEIIIDNDDSMRVDITGIWYPSTTVPEYYGADYVHDNKEDLGTKVFAYHPSIVDHGSYEVYLFYSSNNSRASNVPVKIYHSEGTQTVTVNQRLNGGDWHSIGTFALDENSYVEISNTGTNGYVSADGFRVVLTADTHWMPVATPLVSDASSFIDSTVREGKNYIYRIRAITEDNAGTWVESLPVMPQAATANTFASWSATYQAQGLDMSLLTDPDGDGLANWLEYAFALDPSASNSTPITIQVNPSQTEMSVIFTRAQDTADVELHVETSSDLQQWTIYKSYPAGENPAPDAVTNILGTEGNHQTLQVTIPYSEPQLFVRVRALQQ